MNMKQIWDLGYDNPNYRISVALQDLIDRELLKLLQSESVYGVAVVSKFFSDSHEGIVDCMKMRCNLYSINRGKVVSQEDILKLQKVCSFFFGLDMTVREDMLGVEYVAISNEKMQILMDAIDKCGIDIYGYFYPVDSSLSHRQEIYSPDGEWLLRVPNIPFYRIDEGTRKIAPIALRHCSNLQELEVPYTMSYGMLEHALEQCNHEIHMDAYNWPYVIEEDSDQLKEDIRNGKKDEFGFIYSQDGKRLLVADDVDNYRIPEGVEHIEKNALVGCNIGHLDIPYTMNLDGDNCPIWGSESARCDFTVWNTPYDEVDNLIDSSLSDDDDRVWDDHHVAYSKNGKRLLGAQMGFDEEEYWVKDGVTTICSFAFVTCKKYLKLSIPRSVKIIGTEIFGAAGGFIVFR